MHNFHNILSMDILLQNIHHFYRYVYNNDHPAVQLILIVHQFRGF
jgi:hypothetical protein